MAPVTDIVNVVITKGTKTVSQQGFGTPLIMQEVALTGAVPVLFFSSAQAILDEGSLVAGDPGFKAAQAVFAQSPRVEQIAIGYWNNPTDTITEALSSVEAVTGDFYGIMMTNRTKADVLLAAAWVQSISTVKRIFITASDDSVIIDSADGVDTTSIAYTFKNLSYERQTVLYKSDAAITYSDAALLGKLLPLVPGSYTGMFKTLIGESPDLLTDTQDKNALDKNANVYQTIGGVSITRNGTAGSGEFIDITVFIDWLQARITEEVYSTLVNVPKVPYTNAGIASIEAAVRAKLQQGVNNGGIVQSRIDANGKVVSGFTVTVPLVSAVSAGDKIARELNNVTFEATLAGAIHKVNIAGIVTP